MSIENKKEFERIVEDITNNKEFNRLHDELHHGINRYQHSMRVARWTYKICKLFKMKNKAEVTRAALLHDFYIDGELNATNGPGRLTEHPSAALERSLKYYKLDDIQKDIIKTHMFPCNLDVPKHKESWLVSGVDKTVSTYEMIRYKSALYAGIYLLFLFEMIRLPR